MRSYLIDGYNFVFRLGLKSKLSLQTRREEFIKFFSDCASKLHAEVTLIFDGRELPEGSFTRGNWRDIAIIYTHKGLSADDYIIAQVKNSNDPQAIIVVTSDRELANTIRLYGSKTQSIEEFMKFIIKKTHRLSAKEKPSLREPTFHFERLLHIFEERLKKDEDDV